MNLSDTEIPALRRTNRTTPAAVAHKPDQPRGSNRVLLVIATGTGKTYTAFQIIWRLWKSGRKKRILFLADRNVLVDGLPADRAHLRSG